MTGRIKRMPRWGWAVLGFVGFVALSGLASNGGSSSSCKVLSARSASNSYIIRGEWDWGVSVITNVKNTGGPRLVTIESMVSSSQGAWTRKKQVHLDRGESQSMEIFFSEPTILAERIKYQTKCI
ncbi:MAG: hypothetical protein HKN30_14085 [Sulfitobacter sp.]|nr:hypothetical protein [Sulfitobacter sp.]